MQKQNFMLCLGVFLVFILGGICGIYFSSTIQILKTIEQTEIRNNCTDIRRSLFYLELLAQHDTEKLKECFEWDIDESLLAIYQYTENDPKLSKFDEYSINSINLAKVYRTSNPRNTKNKITDKIVAAILANPSIVQVQNKK